MDGAWGACVVMKDVVVSACCMWRVVLADMKCMWIVVCPVVDVAAAGWTSGGTCEAERLGSVRIAGCVQDVRLDTGCVDGACCACLVVRGCGGDCVACDVWCWLMSCAYICLTWLRQCVGRGWGGGWMDIAGTCEAVVAGRCAHRVWPPWGLYVGRGARCAMHGWGKGCSCACVACGMSWMRRLGGHQVVREAEVAGRCADRSVCASCGVAECGMHEWGVRGSGGGEMMCVLRVASGAG
jgi:hypothetical protein